MYVRVGYCTCVDKLVFSRRAREHPATGDILRTGWTPVLSAMLISSLGRIFY
jgi:hypothetical protein